MLSEEEKEAIEDLNSFKSINILYGNTFTMFLEELKKYQQATDIVLNLITKLQKENEEKDEKIRNFENECMKFKSFCRRIRRDGHDVDLFNQGQEHKCNQFLNLINGEPYWDYKGKYFYDTDNQIKKYLGIERRNEGC